jgi:glycosyltransferase involved in cell wall biosynthesis
MSVGRGVVVTDTCGLAPAVAEHGAGVVVDATQSALDDAVRGLLDRPGALTEVGGRALTASREHFGMRAVVDRLESLYAAAIVTRR